MKKKPDQTEMTQKNIQEAFWTLYTKQSINKITVKDICHLAGYNRSTFYQYFADVFDVLHKSEDQLLNEINVFVIQFVQQADNLNATLAIKAIFEFLEHFNKYISILCGSHGDTEFIHKVAENLKPIWIKYFFKRDNYTNTEVDLLMEYHIVGLLSMYQKWFIDHKGISVERMIQLSYQTLPDTSCFESFDKELRQ